MSVMGIWCGNDMFSPNESADCSQRLNVGVTSMEEDYDIGLPIRLVD